MWQKARKLLAMSGLAIVAAVATSATVGFALVTAPQAFQRAPVVIPPPPEPPAPPADSIHAVMTPEDSVRLALLDALTLPPDAAPFTRYLRNRDGDLAKIKTGSVAVNMVSRREVIVRPVPVAGGTLLRIDLRLYYPRAEDLEEAIRFWEDFQFDPAFSLLITHDELKRLDEAHWPEAAKGKKLDEIDVIREDSPAIDPEAYRALQGILRTKAPVIDLGYFEARALDTIKDKGVFAVIYGGRYYELSGIKKSKDPKVTDLDLLFDSLGLANIKGGLSFEQLYDRLRSDQRALVRHSGVTKKKRRVDWGHYAGGRDGRLGAWSITNDLANQDIDVDNDPFANLATFKAAAFEIIFDKPNGLHAYLLADGNKALLEAADQKVASDAESSLSKYTTELSINRCPACHEAEGSDGWRTFPNDLKPILKHTDVFGDRRLNPVLSDEVDRLASWYQGDPTVWLQRTRADYSGSVLAASGPWKEGPEDQTGVVKVAVGRLVDEEGEAKYGSVDAQAALEDLGIHVPKEQAVDVLNRVLPPDLAAIQEDGVIPELPTLAALKGGLSVSRYDWGLNESFAAVRSKGPIREFLRTKP